MIHNNCDYCVCIERILYNTRMILDKHWQRFWQIPYLNWVTYSRLNNYKPHTDEEMHLEINPFHDVHTFRSCLIISNDFLLEWCSVRGAVTPLGVCLLQLCRRKQQHSLQALEHPDCWKALVHTVHCHSHWIHQDTQNTVWFRKTANIHTVPNIWHLALLLFAWLSYSSATLLRTQINQRESLGGACYL